jgi:hypothetical protein
MSQEPSVGAWTSMGHRLVSEVSRTSLWQLVLFAGLCTYWFVRSIMQNGSLTAFDRWDFWTWLEIVFFAIGALIFLVATVAKLRGMRS